MSSGVFSWLLMLELVLPFVLLSAVLLVVLIRSRRQSKQSFHLLIENIKDNEDDIRLETKNFLINALNYSDSEAEAQVNQIMRQRKAFFRTLISATLKKDHEGIAYLDDELARFVGMYHQLTQQEPVDLKDVPDDIKGALGLEEDAAAADQEGISKLKVENKRLKQEVHVTLTALNNIFGEYASMFGDEMKRRDMSVDEILKAMEAFGQKVATGISSATASVPSAESETDAPAAEVFDTEAADSSNEPDTELQNGSVKEHPQEPVSDEAEVNAEDSSEEEAAATEEEPAAVEENMSETDEADDAALDFIKDLGDPPEHEAAAPAVTNDSPETEEEPSWEEAFAEMGQSVPEDGDEQEDPKKE